MKYSWASTLVLTVVYLAAYLVASALDLWTTEVALREAGVSEGNVFATEGGSYAAGKAWAITVVAAVVLVACVVFSAVYAHRVAEVWLRHPMRSFARLYMNPWSKAVIDRSPLHALSYAIAFVVLRLIAAANNLLIVGCGIAPLGSLVKTVSTLTSPIVGLVVVIGAAYVLLAIGLSPLAARLIAAQRRTA